MQKNIFIYAVLISFLLFFANGCFDNTSKSNSDYQLNKAIFTVNGTEYKFTTDYPFDAINSEKWKCCFWDEWDPIYN